MLDYLNESRLPHQSFEEFMYGIALEERALRESVSELKTAVLSSRTGREFELTMNAGGALRAKGDVTTRKTPTAAPRPAETLNDLNPSQPWIYESPIQEIGGELHPFRREPVAAVGTREEATRTDFGGGAQRNDRAPRLTLGEKMEAAYHREKSRQARMAGATMVPIAPDDATSSPEAVDIDPGAENIAPDDADTSPEVAAIAAAAAGHNTSEADAIPHGERATQERTALTE
jgi:hypothetical protein